MDRTRAGIFGQSGKSRSGQIYGWDMPSKIVTCDSFSSDVLDPVWPVQARRTLRIRKSILLRPLANIGGATRDKWSRFPPVRDLMINAKIWGR